MPPTLTIEITVSIDLDHLNNTSIPQVVQTLTSNLPLTLELTIPSFNTRSLFFKNTQPAEAKDLAEQVSNTLKKLGLNPTIFDGKSDYVLEAAGLPCVVAYFVKEQETKVSPLDPEIRALLEDAKETLTLVCQNGWEHYTDQFIVSTKLTYEEELERGDRTAYQTLKKIKEALAKYPEAEEESGQN
jgi:hypothetical protein